jgi:hypothetical protein
MKSKFTVRLTLLLLAILHFFVFQKVMAQSFVHPGILHTLSDFQRMKDKIVGNEEPWISAYNVFKADNASQKTYTLRGPASAVQRDKNGLSNYTIFIRDASAAYNNAVMWQLTGDTAHAKKAIEIMNAWSYTLDSLYGSDAQLGAGQIGFRWANAAEIIRSTYSGWAASDVEQFETMLKTKFVPWIDMYGDANWGGGCIKAMMAIGIFCNDTAIYNSAINAFYNHPCTSLSKIIGPSGQNTESGRDQIHAQVNIGHLAEVAWVAQSQGLDLFGALDNRILKGFEYQAKYMLGNEVPYDPSIYRCTMGPWSSITSLNRSLPELLPMYEMVYNYYVNRKGLDAPYTTMAAQNTRIETKAAVNYDGEHLIGWGTLMYSLDRGDRQSQTITSFPGIRKKMGDADFDPGAVTSSGLPVFYSSSNAAVATIINNKVHIVSAGTAVITAYQPGNGSYLPAEKVSQTLSLVFNPYVRFKAEDYFSTTGTTTITSNDDSIGTAVSSQGGISNLSYSGALLGSKGASMMYFRYSGTSDTAVTVTVRLDNVNGPKIGTIALKPTGGEQIWKTDSCALNGSTGTRDLWMTFGGKVNLNWMQMDSVKTYNADPVSAPVVKIEAEDYSEKGGNVDWGTPALGNIKSVGWTSYKNVDLNGLTKIDVNAASNSSAGSSISKIIEVRLDALTGPVIATIVVPKTNSWSVYTTVSANVSSVSGKHNLYFKYTVSGGTFTSYLYNIDWYRFYYNTQSISFPPLAVKKITDEDFDPAATATSGLAVTYTSENPAVATIVNGKVHINAVGSAVIKAYQPGNSSFSAATPVSDTLTVKALEQTINFPAIENKMVGEPDFPLTATASSGLPINYTSSDTSVATVVDGLIHIVGAGTTTITATQNGNAVFAAAPAITQPLSVFMPPLLKAKDVQIEVDGKGNASISPGQIDDGSVSYNGALTLKLDKQTFNCSDIGTPVTVTLTGTDEKGYESSATATVTIVDNQKPLVTAPSNKFFCNTGTNYSLPALVAFDNCGVASIRYTITRATSRNGTGGDASGTFNAGVSSIVWTVTDVHGSVASDTTTVTINAPFSSSIPNVYALNPAVDSKNTLYLGYGPTSITINASPDGGTAPYTFNWSTGQITQSISVGDAGTYTVNITDAKGCNTSSSVVINVVDVRCGNNSDKVTVCHNGTTICVASFAVQEHLNHGDKLGICENATSTSRVNSIDEETISYKVKVYPNPVLENLHIQLHKLEVGATVQIYNTNGTQVLYKRLTNTMEQLSVKALPSGIYYVKVVNGNNVVTEKMVKQ